MGEGETSEVRPKQIKTEFMSYSPSYDALSCKITFHFWQFLPDNNWRCIWAVCSADNIRKPGVRWTRFSAAFESDQELLYTDFAAWWMELSNTLSAGDGNKVNKSVDSPFLSHPSPDALRRLRLPRGRPGIHCEHRHHHDNVRGLHHLLLAGLHQRGQEERGGEVSRGEVKMTKGST